MRLSVRVRPGASRDEAGDFEGDVLRLRVTTTPERGKANEAAIELVAKALDVAKGRVTLVSGAPSRQKVFAIEGMDMTEVRRRLERDRRRS